MADEPQQLSIAYIPHCDELIVTFSQAVQWITLTPGQARDMANRLIAFADSVKPKGTVQ